LSCSGSRFLEIHRWQFQSKIIAHENFKDKLMKKTYPLSFPTSSHFIYSLPIKKGRRWLWGDFPWLSQPSPASTFRSRCSLHSREWNRSTCACSLVCTG
jgi:hypothetical protein